MQVKKILSLFVGLPVLIAGVAISFNTIPNNENTTPAEDPCPVKCCQKKKNCSPAKPETNYPETQSIFLPVDFFTGV